MSQVTYLTTRNIWRSAKEYLENKASDESLDVKIAASFEYAYEKDNEGTAMITVGVEDVISTRKEIGSNELLKTYRLVVDIFGTSQGEKLDLTDWVEESLKSGFKYYEYVVDSPDSTNLINASVVTKTEIGKIEIKGYLSNRNVRLGNDCSKRDQHRRVILFQCFLNES